MSAKHPVIAVTGSSGAGTTTVKRSFEHIFHRESIRPAVVEGDSFHRFDRSGMVAAIKEAEDKGERPPSHFGPEGNLFEELERLFKTYGDTGSGKRRFYVHNDEEACDLGHESGTFTPWEDLPDDTDLLFYEGLHGGVQHGDVNVARWVDLLIGVVPIVNLEWIQKIHRDTRLRSYSIEAVTDTILRRMHDYVHYITPQFALHTRELPAGAGGGHVQPVHGQGHPHPGRVARHHPLPRPQGRGLPLPAHHDPRLVHVAAQLHRGAGRQDGDGHTAGGHADAPHHHGAAQERSARRPAVLSARGGAGLRPAPPDGVVHSAHCSAGSGTACAGRPLETSRNTA